MIQNRSPAAVVGTADGAGNVDQAGKRVDLPYSSKKPTRVKYFGRHATAAGAAMRLVVAAFCEPDCKELRLFTCPDRRSDPLPEGVSAAEVCFDRSQIDDAVRWTTACLTAGWIFFRRECRS